MTVMDVRTNIQGQQDFKDKDEMMMLMQTDEPTGSSSWSQLNQKKKCMNSKYVEAVVACLTAQILKLHMFESLTGQHG